MSERRVVVTRASGIAPMQRAQILRGDSLEAMREMPAESVDAICTSPPYADQRTYGGSARKGVRNASRAQRSRAPLEGAAFLEPFLAEMLRVLKPEGSLALNLGVVMRDLEESPWADQVLADARAMGWKLLQRMVWHKPNAIPLSDARYLHIKHEWVFWLAKDARLAYRGFDADTRVPHSESSIRRSADIYLSSKDERYGRRGKSHELHPDGARPTSIYTAGVGQQSTMHPAVMSPKLALHLVSLTCPPGGTVPEPANGSKTTLLAAQARGRRSIGYEENREYFDEAMERLALGPAAAFARARPRPAEGQLVLGGAP